MVDDEEKSEEGSCSTSMSPLLVLHSVMLHVSCEILMLRIYEIEEHLQ